MFNSSMAIDSIREGNPDLEFGVAAIPCGNPQVTVAGGEILAVADNENKEYAIQFLKFLADKKRMKEYIDEFGFLAPRQEIMQQQFENDKEKGTFIDLYQNARTREISGNWPQISLTLSDTLREILVNENDSQTILDKSAEKDREYWSRKQMKKRKKNLRQILIPAFIITACIPLAIFALISQERLKTSTLENMNNQAEADLQKANQSLNMTLDKYETLLYAITTDEEFLSLVVNANDSEEIPEADAYNMRRDFSHICNRNEGVDGIQLVLSDKRRIFYDRLSSSSVNSTWMEKVKIPDETKLLSYDVDKDTDNPERMFHIGRKVVNYWDISEDLGYVILSVNLDELESVLSAGKGSRVYLVKDGVIVGAEDTKMLGRQEKALDSAKVNQKAIKNARSGWSILLCQSIREYQKAIEEQVIFWIMVALAVLLIFVLLIYRVTKPVMISVNDIVDAMKNLEKDNFREKLEVKEKDSTEIQEISEGFNEMSERIHNLIGQVKESAMEQKNAEISALEAQIDPHFLYNILDTINWKAIENEQYEISEMLVALADILRYAINDAGEFTTIDAEKGWLKNTSFSSRKNWEKRLNWNLKFKIRTGNARFTRCCCSHLWRMRSNIVSVVMKEHIV